MMELKENKMKNLILYIAKKCYTNRNYGNTFLYKALYFSDFDFYEEFGKSITGETYIKLSLGPAPRHFKEIISKMKDEGKIKENRIKYSNGNTQRKQLNLVEPDLSLFKKEELETIDRAISKIEAFSPTKISDFSHGDIPWKATDNKEEIDYDLVHYRREPYSVKCE